MLVVFKFFRRKTLSLERDLRQWQSYTACFLVKVLKSPSFFGDWRHQLKVLKSPSFFGDWRHQLKVLKSPLFFGDWRHQLKVLKVPIVLRRSAASVKVLKSSSSFGERRHQWWLKTSTLSCVLRQEKVLLAFERVQARKSPPRLWASAGKKKSSSPLSECRRER